MEFHKDVYHDLGFGPENIKVIKGFLSKEECIKLLSLLDDNDSLMRPVQWDEIGTPITSLYKYESFIPTAQQYAPTVKSLVEKAFNVNIKTRHAIIKKWEHSKITSIPIDDLGTTDHNNIYACIYLNDNYQGGELLFPNQKVLFKPMAGDLVIFPASAAYRYIVKDVVGSRYVIPIWFDFVK